MKLTILLLTVAFLNVQAGAAAQTITLKGKDIPLRKVFSEIKKQTGYVVFTSKEILAGLRPVSLTAYKLPLDDFMRLLLKGQPLVYTIEDRTIVLTKKAIDIKPVPPSEEQRQSGVTYSVPPIAIKIHVSDSTGVPLSNATVMIRGTKKGGQTDAQGNIMLTDVDNDAVLVISFTGYKTTEFKLKGQRILDIVLGMSTSPLDAVQVIAYGSNTMRFNVGAVATVTAAQIEQQPVTNPLLALEGRVAGLSVTPGSGVPGTSVRIQIRGSNRLNGQYDQPLFIIDGVPFAPQNSNANKFNSLAVGATNVILPLSQSGRGISPFNNINPLDIESISFLKDADATSIYGSQGSNGVIIITTKKGKAGKTGLELSVHTGVNKVTRSTDMMNTEQYRKMQWQALANDGAGWAIFPYFVPSFDPSLTLFDKDKNVNWFKQFYGSTAGNTSAHGTLSGGNAGTSFIASVGITDQGYNFPGDFSNKTYSLHTGLIHSSANHKLNIDFGSDYSYNQNNSTGAPSVLQAFTLPPNFPDLLDANNNLAWSYKGIDLGINPFSYLKQSANLEANNLNTHLNINYRLLSGLNAGILLGYNWFNTKEYEAQPLSSFNPAQGQASSAGFGGGNDQVLNITPKLTYEKTINQGRFTALLGGEYKQSVNAGNQQTGLNYSNDALLGSINGAQTVYASDSYSKYKYAGAFGRIGYIHANKYILNVTMRRDGSSNFGPGRQFGNFGSLAAGWIFSEEPAFKKNFPFITYGKLNASYGTQGGDGIAPYQYQPNWQSLGSQYIFQGVVPYSPVNLFNEAYSWDINKKINLGISLGFLNDRILADLNVYQNRSGNQLISYSLPIQTGYTAVTMNQPATVQNKGWEINVSSVNIKNKDFAWNTTFNISGNQNKLVAFPGLEKSSYSNSYVVGQSTSLIYGFEYLGVNPSTGLFQFRGANGQPTSAPVYGLATNLTNPGDMIPIADVTPKFFGGLSNEISYKGLSLMLFFQYSKQTGMNYKGGLYAGAVPGAMGYNLPSQLLNNLWQSPGDVAEFQKLSAGFNSLAYGAAYAFSRSSGAFSDASYIRLKTMSLTWNMPESYLKKTGLQRASIYINAQNLFVITPYQLLDPEMAGQLYGFPLQKTIVAGLTLTF